MIKNQEDGDLMKRVSNKDQEAMKEITIKFGKKVYLDAIKSLRSNQEAEDASQDIFIKIWKNSSKYDPTKSKLITWISVITDRTLIDAFRKKMQHKRPSLFSENLVLSKDRNSIVETKDEYKKVLKKLVLLTDKQREIIELVYMKELTLTQISELKNIPKQTTRSLFRRGMVNLKTLVK